MKKTLLRKINNGLKDFYEGAFKMSASSIIRKEAFNTNDDFILVLFGDFLGIPINKINHKFKGLILSYIPLLDSDIQNIRDLQKLAAYLTPYFK